MNGRLTYSHLGQTRTIALGKAATIVGSSASADLRISSPSIEAYHCALAWEPRGATWMLSAPSSAARETIEVNQKPLSGSTPLSDGDVIALPDVIMRFHLEAAPPRFEGREQLEIPLGQRKTLILGRATTEPSADPKVELDAEDTRLSRIHVIIEQDGQGGVFAVDKGRTDTFLNGQRFNRRQLVVGHRLRFANYAFEFTGSSLRVITNATGAKIEARHLTAMTAQGEPLVQDVTLTLTPCSLVGILGLSQEHKDALLQALAGRLRISGGELHCNGAIFSGARPESWIPRDDTFYEELTVVETLRYRAHLQLPARTPKSAMRALVDATLARVGLEAVREEPIARLSPAQKRRVALASALLMHPRVLFLEEPTRDLDPESEWEFLELLRQIAGADCTVVCTTHLGGRAFPFDHLCVTHEGYAIFEGSPDEAKRYFGAESLEEIYSKLRRPPQKSGAEWRQAFEASQPAASASRAFPAESPPTSVRVERPGAFYHLGLSVARQWRRATRSPARQGWALAAPILLGLFLSWVPADPVQRFFLALVGLLWIGSVRACRLWAGDLAVLRSERSLGVRPQLGLQSSVLFLAASSAVQAVALFLVMSSCTRVFHTHGTHPEMLGPTLNQRFAAAGHPAWMTSVVLNASLSLDCATNIVDATTVLPGAQPSDPLWQSILVIGVVLTGKLLVLLGAATLGVILGLAASAWAEEPARALLWSQIAILPQIALAGVLVTLPEMSGSARFIAAGLPIPALERAAECVQIHGQATPRLSNHTRLPLFYDGPSDDRLVTWEEQGHPVTEGYARLSAWNRAWQNLLVTPSLLGQHHPEFHITRGVTKVEDFASHRADVSLNSGVLYATLGSAVMGALVTFLWISLGYGAALVGLGRRME